MDSQRQAAGDAGTRPLWFGPHEPRSTPSRFSRGSVARSIIRTLRSRS